MYKNSVDVFQSPIIVDSTSSHFCVFVTLIGVGISKNGHNKAVFQKQIK